MNNYGYITYVDDNPKYLKLLDILIESILSFSDNHVEVFSINFNFNHSSDRVHSRRVNLKNKNFFSITNVKPYAACNSMFDLGILLDSDVIITDRTDSLFDEFNERDLLFPIAPLHPEDVFVEQVIFDIFGIKKRTQHYVHADTFIYSNNSKPFLEKWYDSGNMLIQKGITPSVVDETIFNALLWKYERVNTFTDIYDPYYKCFIDFTEENLLNHGYKNPSTVRNIICHGCKDIEKARTIYANLLNSKEL